jgi:hypothetical protein
MQSPPKEGTMRFVVEIPGELIPLPATTSETAYNGPRSGEALSAGAAPDMASLTYALPATDALPAGEAEFGGVLRAAEYSDESAQDAGPAPS